MALCGASNTIAMHQSPGHGVHRIIDQARALNSDLSDAFDDSLIACEINMIKQDY